MIGRNLNVSEIPKSKTLFKPFMSLSKNPGVDKIKENFKKRVKNFGKISFQFVKVKKPKKCFFFPGNQNEKDKQKL